MGPDFDRDAVTRATVLDGNVLAGVIVAATGSDATDVPVRCGSCGHAHPLGAARVEITRERWAARCPSCASITLVVNDGELRWIAGSAFEPAATA